MKPQGSTLAIWVAALWWGSLTAVGFGVVPLLFVHLPSPVMAGGMAAKLFSVLTWLTLVCGMILLVFLRSNAAEVLDSRAKNALFFIVSGMLLAMLSEFAIAPRIVARQDLLLWHSLGVVIYALQWVCATVTLKRFACGRTLDNQDIKARPG